MISNSILRPFAQGPSTISRVTTFPGRAAEGESKYSDYFLGPVKQICVLSLNQTGRFSAGGISTAREAQFNKQFYSLDSTDSCILQADVMYASDVVILRR